MLGRLRARAPYVVYRSAASVVQALPAAVGAPAAAGVGAGLAMALRGRRAMVERHLRRVHGPGLSGLALEWEVQRTFASYTRYWYESFRLPATSPEDIAEGMTHEGFSYLQAAMAAGRGAILALPHLGAWDFGGAWFALQGYPVTVVVEPLAPPELFEWFSAHRRALGMTVVPLGPGAGPAVLGALHRGEAVALLCDRDIAGGGVEVEFFGERTTLPSGPATLALRTGAPILATAVYFEGPRGHHGVVRPPLVVERAGSFREDVTRVTQAVAGELEALIRRSPSQWHLLQPNWPSDRRP